MSPLLAYRIRRKSKLQVQTSLPGSFKPSIKRTLWFVNKILILPCINGWVSRDVQVQGGSVFVEVRLVDVGIAEEIRHLVTILSGLCRPSIRCALWLVEKIWWHGNQLLRILGIVHTAGAHETVDQVYFMTKKKKRGGEYVLPRAWTVGSQFIVNGWTGSGLRLLVKCSMYLDC